MIRFTTSIKATTKNQQPKQLPANELIESLYSGKMMECYELIASDSDIKPYFDIEVKKEKHATLWSEYSEKPSKLLENCKRWLEEQFPKAEFCCSECHRKDILSYHIIISNYVTSMSELIKLKSRFPNDAFDRSVYNSSGSEPQKFRTVLSIKTKDGMESPQLMPVDHKNESELTSHLVTNPDQAAIRFIAQDQVQCLLDVKDDTSQNKTLGDHLENWESIDRAEWIKIGISIANVTLPELAKAEFLKFSEQHSSHNIEKFEKTWKWIANLQPKRGGWNLLKKYLPKIYHRKYLPVIYAPGTKLELPIAEFILKEFDLFEIKSCGTIKNRVWFVFKQHRWFESNEIELSKQIIIEWLINRYNNDIDIIREKIANTSDETDRKKLEKLDEEMYKARISLKTNETINKIMIMLSRLTFDADFEKKIDQNRYLLGFNNGVFDLKSKTFRDGQPEDYITKTVGYDYCETVDHARVDYLQSKLKQIFFREGLYETFIDTISRSMIGDNSISSQLFYCWYGVGSNAKSTLKTLMEQTFGDYCVSIPTTYLTQKSQRADGANPEVSRMVGTRYVFMSESELDHDINIATLKNNSGENTIPYRGLYQPKILETLITWTLFLLTNEKMALPDCDEGVARRVRYLQFYAKFVDNPQDYKPHKNFQYFPKDEHLIKELSTYKTAFMHLLLEKLDHQSGPKFPTWLLNITDDMIKSQDKLTSLLENLFEKADDKSGLKWEHMKKLLSKDKMFHQLKFKSVADLQEKIEKRLTYATHEKNSYALQFQSNVVLSLDTNTLEIKKTGSLTKSKSFFRGIRARDDIEENDCVI